ncbi:MAG: transketolase C-terminal domain-containing protein, partial [Tepidisphaeraceae bacterium]
PVIILEHKSLFATRDEVPTGEHLVPVGVARVARRGRDLTIVTGGLLLHRCLEAAAELEKQSIPCEHHVPFIFVRLRHTTISASPPASRPRSFSAGTTRWSCSTLRSADDTGDPRGSHFRCN